jgi:hypothetical protein
MVSLFINRPIQTQEDLTIEYGEPYWQIFWNHLSLDQQRQIKIQYPDITFPLVFNIFLLKFSGFKLLNLF